MAIYIVRHGETECNVRGVIQFADDPLTGRGQRQAERVAARLAGAGIARIVCSDYLRAYHTAERIHVATGASLQTSELLRERHFGELRGRPAAEVGNIWRDDLAPCGGEDWARFHDRVADAWRYVTALDASFDGNLAVVTHGMVCYSLVTRQLYLPDPGETPLLCGNTAVTVVDPRPPWTIHTLYCVSHLDDLDTPESLPSPSAAAAEAH